MIIKLKNRIEYEVSKIAKHTIDKKDVDLIEKLIKNNEFEKVSQLIEKVQVNNS